MTGRDTIKKVAVPCDCGCGVALVTRFEQWGDNPEQVYVDFFASASETRLRGRARAAWRVLRGKDPWLHSIVLQGDGLHDVRRAFGVQP